jgi:hypothetical protein
MPILASFCDLFLFTADNNYNNIYLKAKDSEPLAAKLSNTDTNRGLHIMRHHFETLLAARQFIAKRGGSLYIEDCSNYWVTV